MNWDGRTCRHRDGTYRVEALLVGEQVAGVTLLGLSQCMGCCLCCQVSDGPHSCPHGKSMLLLPVSVAAFLSMQTKQLCFGSCALHVRLHMAGGKEADEYHLLLPVSQAVPMQV